MYHSLILSVDEEFVKKKKNSVDEERVLVGVVSVSEEVELMVIGSEIFFFF